MFGCLATTPVGREKGNVKAAVNKHFYNFAIKIILWSRKNYFGEHQENNNGRREKRVKFQREPGDGDPPPSQ